MISLEARCYEFRTNLSITSRVIFAYLRFDMNSRAHQLCIICGTDGKFYAQIQLLHIIDLLS